MMDVLDAGGQLSIGLTLYGKGRSHDWNINVSTSDDNSFNCLLSMTFVFVV